MFEFYDNALVRLFGGMTKWLESPIRAALVNDEYLFFKDSYVYRQISDYVIDCEGGNPLLVNKHTDNMLQPILGKYKANDITFKFKGEGKKPGGIVLYHHYYHHLNDNTSTDPLSHLLTYCKISSNRLFGDIKMNVGPEKGYYFEVDFSDYGAWREG